MLFKLKERICKIKQYLNYTYWWYKSKYSSRKEFMKNSTPRRQLPKLRLLNFWGNFLTETKYLLKTYKTNQKTLDAIIGKKHSEVIKNRIFLHTLSTICYIKVCQINWIKVFLNIFRVDWDFSFSPFHKFGYGDKFIHIVEDAYTNIRSKIKTNGLLSDPFTLTWGVG